MSELKDVRGMRIEVGDIIAWPGTHDRGRLYHGEVEDIQVNATGPDFDRYRLTVVCDETYGTEQRTLRRSVRRTKNLVVVEKFYDLPETQPRL